MAKKHETIPNEPEEMPQQPNRPEVQQPIDPKEPEISRREIEEIPEELPGEENNKKAN